MTISISTLRFHKLYISLKFRLFGLGYYKALEALETCKAIHCGFRKDGITPEFQHQLEIAHYLMTLKGVEDLEKVIIVALYHDADEDHPHAIPTGTLESLGKKLMAGIRKLNKHTFQSEADYFEANSKDPITSLVKGADRVNNFQSMSRGKFSIEKQKKYAHEVVTYFLPMLKAARRNFPRQMDAYYNIENMLKSQLELVTLYINAHETKTI